jgi:hypothetical protein
MSVNLQSAFNYALDLNGRVIELWDNETDTSYNIKMSLSNYVRNLFAVDDMVIEGREFVVSKSTMDEISLLPKRGMKIIDSELGSYTISEVREMMGLGEILGYRLRTN